MNKTNGVPDCCKPKKANGFWQGLAYGLFPHSGCIAFILASVLGMATMASVFRPLMMKSYFFYSMAALSLVFATISAYFYLRKHGGMKNARHHKGYLGILYGTTIGISALLYFVVFPAMAGAQITSPAAYVPQQTALEKVTLDVNIPCAGHGPLIIDSLKSISGVVNVQYLPISKFIVSFDPARTSREQILGMSVFSEYKARIAG